MRQPEPGAGLRADVIAVGSELLTGDIVDTNSAWVAQRLSGLGINVRHVTVVGDVLDDLVATLRTAVTAADLVVVSGGLGPTPDDLTRFAVADVAGVPLERRDDLVDGIRRFFAELGRRMADTNLVQADLPVGATAIPPAGTAPGFTIEVDGTLVIALPGVPSELHTMMDRSVTPLLRRRGGLAVTVSRTVHTAAVAESDVAERCADVVDRVHRAGRAQVAFLASQGRTRVRVSARARDAAAAHAVVDPVVAEIVDRLGPAVTGLDDEGVEHAIARILGARGWTLAVAESITGGGVGARLVTVPGASGWFTGGVVTYATAAKSVLAAVPERVLAEHGPVSEETARALAVGIRGRLDTDVGLAVVGVAGPTTQGDRRVGTVCVAVAVHGSVHTRTVHLPPRSRVESQGFATTTALEYLRRRLRAMDGS
ncbi:MAG TPA: competence/damage-inducible protein A [Euzebyales bacterium]|nr:competence/damage-inducible protein A [Euzebyales bacterium]